MSLKGDVVFVAALVVALYLAWRWITSSAPGQAVAAWAAGTFSGDAILPDGTPNPAATTPFGTPIQLPYPDPKNLDEQLKNSVVTGIPPAGVTTDQWIDYQTTGVLS